MKKKLFEAFLVNCKEILKFLHDFKPRATVQTKSRQKQTSYSHHIGQAVLACTSSEESCGLCGSKALLPATKSSKHKLLEWPK